MKNNSNTQAPSPISQVKGVILDRDTLIRTREDGQIDQIALKDLQEVAIITLEEGRHREDLFWVLKTKDRGGCTIAAGTQGATALLPRLQKLPGFDMQAVVDAMATTQNAKFICWRKTTSAL